ncbi:ATP-grasp domain-containing protein [Schinkia azotoformans]|uniref:ATP-grasp domain-containing protein n=1 Tax=Schinkia azotoformans LMG 9581 TaxID=1131731 RepID=K6DH92_SCHAZ|nr:ATP-grasp domain-containing protein [Schinkia azotoformans]EKN67674.1 hypothetical protein BAZO_07329 [Schinkia azotoformans LMG 9581]MEC1637554.1 ATP-grasp domain-containing protein [Schinkia azotoformans]MEC1943958.1 ATP-grasp domain-containing protein [Schinkia azotoformans]
MNVLVTSISRKIPLINEVQKAGNKLGINSLIYGADSNSEAIGKFFVDNFWHMPLLNELKIEDLITYCKSNDIKAIIPTRDGELVFFSKYRELLRENNINAMISDETTIKNCLDKLAYFSIAKEMGYPVINTYVDIEDLTCDSFVVKERYGAGAKKIGINLTKQEAIRHAKYLKKPIFQPFIKGQEYSVDIFIDMVGKIKGSVVRKRDLVLNGESQITTTINFTRLEILCEQFASELKFYGHIIMQVIVDLEGNIHFIECNPRFGGASTLSIAVGLDSFYWFLLEVRGFNLDDISFERSKSEKRLIRYPKDWILEIEEKEKLLKNKNEMFYPK